VKRKAKELRAIETIRGRMRFLVEGYVNPRFPLYSPKDLTMFLGKSRQLWGKVIGNGQLEAYWTSAGPIVTTEQLVKFYQLQ